MEKYKPAGFWIRFLANIIDGILIYIIGAIIAILINDERFFSSPGNEANTWYSSPSEDISNLIYVVVFIIIFTASKYKGSPGKLACRIQVLNVEMTQISMLKSIGRFFAYFLSALPLGIGFLMAGWNEEKKGLHDIICSTRVVYRI
ncbi:RDD family protein [Virgibacillus litoralis]|uniref:RDD family membrane protein YckC n=1 Tax=Virgibacillus litoralis TaxID=578221 RepID=A0ABS4H9A6_9BACI|nr:RDD family protein [Virgibacillus litoralis]MBP1947484.1 putative RDD family membrane protein YckC [Virgibacillus litoralis]